MLSIEECKKIFGNNLTHEQIKNLRDILYTLVENIIDNYISTYDKIEKL
jgi:hypothetical protein